MKLKTIFFDLGGVLVNFSHTKMCENIGQLCGASPEKILHALFTTGLGEKYEKGTVTLDEVDAHLKTLSRRCYKRSELIQASCDIFSPKKEMGPIVDWVKSKGIQLILLSNTVDIHFNFIKENFSVLEPFDNYVLSFKFGTRKPDPAIFEAALSLASTPIEECFYIDDVKEYVDAANQMGLKSHQFTTKESLLPHLEGYLGTIG